MLCLELGIGLGLNLKSSFDWLASIGGLPNGGFYNASPCLQLLLLESDTPKVYTIYHKYIKHATDSESLEAL